MRDSPSAPRMITAVLFTAQCLASAGFIATFTVSTIVAASLSGQRSLAGFPSALSTLTGSGAAFILGMLMDRIGRRPSLALGLLCGIIGASCCVGAIAMGSFALFVGGMMLMGIANAAVSLSRFIAAEVHSPETRGRAVSYVVLGGTAGAIVGPLLVKPTGVLAVGAGTSELAGAFAAAAVLLLASAIVVAAALRPEPKTLIVRADGAEAGNDPPRSMREILRLPAAGAAVSAMVFSQVVMVALMVITSLYMQDMHHGLGEISLVISAHTIGMYAFSLVSGRLIDKWGRRPVIILGAVVLIVACATAPLSGDTLPLAVSLLLLGLGWNFCFVGGSTLLSDQLRPAERGRIQGFNDLLVGLAAAGGSLGSGFVAARFGYAGVGIAGIMLALLPLLFVARWARAARRGEKQAR